MIRYVIYAVRKELFFIECISGFLYFLQPSFLPSFLIEILQYIFHEFLKRFPIFYVYPCRYKQFFCKLCPFNFGDIVYFSLCFAHSNFHYFLWQNHFHKIYLILPDYKAFPKSISFPFLPVMLLVPL